MFPDCLKDLGNVPLLGGSRSAAYLMEGRGTLIRIKVGRKVDRNRLREERLAIIYWLTSFPLLIIKKKERLLVDQSVILHLCRKLF